jgi:NDP-sugar pyrophosphorylase family protein
MQVVILVGGLATRLGKLAYNTPKSMILIEGRPFLEYQLELISKQNIKDIVLCVGHLGEKIKSYFNDGKKFGVKIDYSWEETLLGTGGAIKNAEGLLQNEFMMLYGDSYLPVDYHKLINIFIGKNTLGTMVIYKNNNKYDKSNIVLNEGRIKAYDKEKKLPEMVYIDAGLSIFKKEVLKKLPDGKHIPLDTIIKQLIDSGQLSSYITKQRFYEVGSPKGLQDFRNYISTRTSK